MKIIKCIFGLALVPLILGLVTATSVSAVTSATKSSIVETNEVEFSNLDDVIAAIADESAAQIDFSDGENVLPDIIQVTDISNAYKRELFPIRNARTAAYDRYKKGKTTVVYKTLGGYAAGQGTKGFYRNKGDLIGYSSKGGSKISGSITVKLYGAFSVSLGLGTAKEGKGVNGYLKVPSKGWWKYYRQEKYKITYTQIYGHPYNSPTNTWQRVKTAPTATKYGNLDHLVKQ